MIKKLNIRNDSILPSIFLILLVIIGTMTLLSGCSGSGKNYNSNYATHSASINDLNKNKSKATKNYLNKKPNIKVWSKATAIYLIKKKLSQTKAVISKTNFNPNFFSNVSNAPILVKNQLHLELLPRNSKLFKAFIDARSNFFYSLHPYGFKKRKESTTIYFDLGTFKLKNIIKCSRDKDAKSLAQCKYSWSFFPNNHYYAIKKLVVDVYKVYLLPNSNITRTFALPYPLPIHHGYAKIFTLLEKKYPFYLNLTTSGMAIALLQKNKNEWRININNGIGLKRFF